MMALSRLRPATSPDTCRRKEEEMELGVEPYQHTGHYRMRPAGAYWSTATYNAPAMTATTMTATLELSDVLNAARLGDDSAFGQLIDHYFSAAQRLAQQILQTEEAAADAVQEALIKVHRALPRFQEGNFRSWLLRIVTNTCYDHLRSQKRRMAVSLDELAEQSTLDAYLVADPPAQNPEYVVTQEENLQFLIRAIEELPEWHRNVVVLIDVHGYDYAEAAEILGLPLGTVKSRLSRARSALRDSLVASGFVSPERLAA
jgi:RNA polymerase sigma-70 factor (ECF subfamily)